MKQNLVLSEVEIKKAAAFGRLCVETRSRLWIQERWIAAAFGRLCVETTTQTAQIQTAVGSRLRAAVC